MQPCGNYASDLVHILGENKIKINRKNLVLFPDLTPHNLKQIRCNNSKNNLQLSFGSSSSTP